MSSPIVQKRRFGRRNRPRIDGIWRAGTALVTAAICDMLAKSGDEMEAAVEQPAERRRIEADLVGQPFDLEAELRPDAAPLAVGQVIVGEDDAVLGVADPVHEPQ